MKIRYDSDIMEYMSFFESLTKAKLKDCIVNERIIFVVQENEMGKAIGKKGSNIRRIKEMLKKNIKVVEFNQDVLQFVRNMMYPLQPKDLRDEDGVITIIGPDTKTKALLIGRDSRNLENLTNVVKRYFQVKEIRVV